MKFFGLLSVLLATMLGIWWVSNTAVAPGLPSDSEAAPTTNVYQDALDSARDIAGVEQIEIYDGIAVAKNQTIVDLSGRSLTGSLKAEVRHLSQVEVLDLSNNQFTGLPAEVGQLSQLRVLNLANNPLTGLPHELGNLQQLEILNLKGTNYAKADLQVIQAGLPSTTSVLVD